MLSRKAAPASSSHKRLRAREEDPPKGKRQRMDESDEGNDTSDGGETILDEFSDDEDDMGTRGYDFLLDASKQSAAVTETSGFFFFF